ncbi:MAG: hypothetical protein ABIN36_07940 [Ferruginibacter sp.]
MPVKPGGNFIDLSYARQLAQNFVETKLQPGTISTEDTQAVWFSKENILALLGVDTSLGSAEVSGVRIYFGAYKDHEDYPANAADQNKMTLVLVTTGIETIEVTRGTVTETAYLDLIEGDITTPPAYPVNNTPVEKSAYLNEGQLVPPPSDATGLGLMDW